MEIQNFNFYSEGLKNVIFRQTPAALCQRTLLSVISEAAVCKNPAGSLSPEFGKLPLAKPPCDMACLPDTILKKSFSVF